LGTYLNNQQDEVALDLDTWQSTAERIAERLGIGDETDWSLTFVDDEAIRTFNREYRGYDKPTDVLAFSQLEGDDDFPMPEEIQILGDVVVAVPTARRQAEERGHAFEAELALLIIHGLLHLLGEDHDTPERKAAMWERQATILSDLGFKIEDFGDQ
jgi:probable rRNA maturation factor